MMRVNEVRDHRLVVELADRVHESKDRLPSIHRPNGISRLPQQALRSGPFGADGERGSAENELTVEDQVSIHQRWEVRELGRGTCTPSSYTSSTTPTTSRQGAIEVSRTR